MTGAEHREHSASVVGAHAQDAESIEAAHSQRELTARELSRSNSVDRYVSKRKNNTRRNILAGVLVALFVFLVVGAVSAWAYINNLNSKLNSKVDDDLRAVLAERQEPMDPFYMLLLGVDKDTERMETDGEEFFNFRADTIILARIDPKDVKVTLVSIPRDTYVDMHENGEGKINGAYSIGGASYMTEVVQEFAGVPISHYAEVDFDAFIAIVDKVGGIDVELPVAISDPEYTGIELDAGMHHLDGWDALMLARSRHAYDDYGGGDFYRAANQRMVISAVARKVLASDFITMSDTISTLADYVTTDMSATDIISLAFQMKDLDIDNNFYSGQEPTISTYYDDLWYEICDTEAWQSMMQRVDQGLPPYSSEEDDFTAGIAGVISHNKPAEEDANAAASTSSIPDDVEPQYEGTVLVLNGTGQDGLASGYCETLGAWGFYADPDTAPELVDTTTIYYNGDEARGKAKGVAEAIGISPNFAANDGSQTTDYDIIIVLGSDVLSE